MDGLVVALQGIHLEESAQTVQTLFTPSSLLTGLG